MKRNDIQLYYISKQIKRIQKKMDNNNLTLFTLMIGFFVNIISILLPLLKDNITLKWYIGINIFLISILSIVIIIYVVFLIKNRTQKVVTFSYREWCTKFDEYVVPNVKCAIELYDVVAELIKNNEQDTPQYRLYTNEINYYLNSSARELKLILTQCPQIIEIWISKERVKIIIDLINYVISNLKLQISNELKNDLKICEEELNHE